MADPEDDLPDPTPEADDLKDAHVEEALGDANDQAQSFSAAGDDPPLEPDPAF